jgi:type II secretory pathway component PulJ
MSDVAKTVAAILIAAVVIAVVWAGYSSMQDSNEFNRDQVDRFQQVEP